MDIIILLFYLLILGWPFSLFVPTTPVKYIGYGLLLLLSLFFILPLLNSAGEGYRGVAAFMTFYYGGYKGDQSLPWLTDAPRLIHRHIGLQQFAFQTSRLAIFFAFISSISILVLTVRLIRRRKRHV